MNFINNRQFVTAWMKCDSVEDVARKLGLRKSQVSAKANSLRKKGVRLPSKLGVKSDDTEALNAIVAKYTKIVPRMVQNNTARRVK